MKSHTIQQNKGNKNNIVNKNLSKMSGLSVSIPDAFYV